ncbi:MAG: GLUG motif-containing protein [Candidatus Cloacimonadaceae bacterium]|nr:GLUG motif-containing protein [Candidatus Cloacimonadaceae bacterium]
MNGRNLDINDFLVQDSGRYLIQSASDILALMAFAQNPAYNYLLSVDIDMSSLPGYFIPLLKGDFDGDGHSISNLYIGGGARRDVGFFGQANSADIRDLNLIDFNVTGGANIGALVGLVSQYSSIINCHGNGNASAIEGFTALGGLIGSAIRSQIDSCSVAITCQSPASSLSSVGGMIGYMERSTLRHSNSSGSITADWLVVGLAGYISTFSSVEHSHSNANVDGCHLVGGLVGFSIDNCVVTHCYSTGAVTGDSFVGGLAGSIDINSYINMSCSSSNVVASIMTGGGLVALLFNSHIVNCYSTGNVTGNDNVGGLVGDIYIYYASATVTTSYSTGAVSGGGSYVGGLIGGRTICYITNSYWDMESSGMTYSNGGEGRTTAEMVFPHAANTFVGWDFSRIWSGDFFHEVNGGYPYLRNTIPGSPTSEIVLKVPRPTLKSYPNPFNPNTTISFDLPRATETRLDVFNIRGQKVKTLCSALFPAGSHSIVWNGRDDNGIACASGIYLCRLSFENKTLNLKMMLIK